MAGRIGTTVAQVSEKTLKLQEYIKRFALGQELSYLRIATDTGIRMDEKGKQYLRTAFKRARIIYSVIIGKGIKIAESKDTMPILVNKLGKIDRAVRRADKTQKSLQEQFFETLTPQEQKELLYIGAVFGAIRVAADNGRLIYKKRNVMSNSQNIPIAPVVY